MPRVAEDVLSVYRWMAQTSWFRRLETCSVAQWTPTRRICSRAAAGTVGHTQVAGFERYQILYAPVEPLPPGGSLGGKNSKLNVVPGAESNSATLGAAVLMNPPIWSPVNDRRTVGTRRRGGRRARGSPADRREAG